MASTDTFLKSSFGWLELKNYSADPTDIDTTRTGLCFVSGVLKKYTSSAWSNVGSGAAASTWDEMYASDKTLDIDSTTLTFAGAHATGDAVTITQGGSSAGACLQLTHAKATENDIRGTSGTWYVQKEGYAVFTRIDLADGVQIRFGDSQDCTVDWGTATLDFSGPVAFEDDVTIASAKSLTLTGTAGTDYLIVTAGDVLLSEGGIAVTDDDNAATLSITNDGATDFGNAADNGVVEIICDTLTSGTLLHLSVTEGTLNGGAYLIGWDETADAAVFSVKENGVIVVAGTAEGTDALTLTVGDATLSDGDIVVSAGSVDITEDATDNVALAVVTAGTSVDAVTITANALTGTEAALSISVDALVDGRGIKVENVGEALTSGELLTIVNTEDGELATKTGNLVSVTSDMEESAGTVTSNYDMALFSRADTQAHASQYDAQGSVVKILKTLDKAAGTIVDAVIALEIESAVANTALPLGATVQITEVGVGATALNIVAAGVGADDVLITGSGAHTADKAVLNVTAGGNIATGGNIVRVDGGATDPNGGAILVEFDFASLADTNEPIGLKIDGGGKKLRALYIDADPVAEDVVYVHSDAVIADNKALLSLHTAGAIASGSNLLRLETTGTPDTGSMVIEVVSPDDCMAMYVGTSSATNHAVHIKGAGDIGADKALLCVESTATAMVADSALVRIQDSGSAAGAGATVYGLIINMDGTNLEGLWVEKGTSTFAEAITVSAGGAAITGTSSVDGAFTVNDSSADVDFRVETDSSTHALEVNGGNNNVSINATGISAHYDLALLGDGVLCIKETTTPTADTNYGKVYCKNDNKLYFQDGSGSEKEIAFA